VSTPADKTGSTPAGTDSESARLRCPSCDVTLMFVTTMIEVINPGEPWDLYVCRPCGTRFEYRRHTTQLTRTP